LSLCVVGQQVPQPSSGVEEKTSDLDAYLRLKILSALEQAALFLYSTTVARYFIPQRLKTVHRRLVFETAPLERAVRGLLRVVDSSEALLGAPKPTKAVAAELVALRMRLDCFREEVTPLVATALAQAQAGDPDVADEEQSLGEFKEEDELQEGGEEEDDGDDGIDEEDEQDDDEEEGEVTEEVRRTDETAPSPAPLCARHT
jgi:hypothetical protein